MSITSGGKSYNASFPVANNNNNSKGFRDNFATLKFAIESLQTAQSGGAVAGGLTSNGSVLRLSASPDDATGGILLKAEYNSTGFRLPENRPATGEAGMVCYENGVLFYHNGTTWQNFIERVGDTVTLTNLVVTSKLSLDYLPTEPTDAVSVQWVQDYIDALPADGMDPAIYTRLDNLESELGAEIELRASEDAAIRAEIATERSRIDDHDTQFTTVNQQITQVSDNLNTRMDGVEELAGQVSNDFSALNQSVQDAVTQINTLAQDVDNDLAQEKAERIAADDALSARIDTINNTTLPGLVESIEAERDARISADNALQQDITAANTAINAERDERIAQGNVQQNSIAALADAVDQSNAIVMGMSDRIDAVADDLVTERTNREAGDLAERMARTAAVAALGTRIDQEAAARQQADTNLQSDIDAETSAREQADTALENDIASETTAREQAIAAEAAARDQAVAAERADRESQDAALQNDINQEVSDRQQAVTAEAAARDQAVAAETTARNQAIAAEATARNDAISAEAAARNNALSSEATSRADADAALQAQIDALEQGSANNDYLDKSDGGVVTGPVTIQNTSLTLENSEFYLPGSNVTIDASRALLFTKLPNTTGVGDGAFVTYDENNFRYAYLDDGAATGPERTQQVALGGAANEFACLRLGSTNDPAGLVADSVAIEAAAHLYLNPGWTGSGIAEDSRTPVPGSFVIVGDALTWKVRIARDSGDIVTRGRIDADGDIQGLSDESVKDNVRQITGALDKLEALVGVMYDRNDQDGKASTGLIAQNVKMVMPEVVGQREDGKLTVAYGNLMGLVIEAIKELRAEVKSLKP